MNLSDRLQNLLKDLRWDAEQVDLDFMPFDISRYQMQILGKVRPKDKSQAAELLKLCRRHEIHIHPFSKGNNWAFGGVLPAEPNCLLVDLSSLDQIESLDEEFGVAVIQPGVTQGMLCDFLKRANSNYYLDVTGSGSETSVLGNALERGIAYNSLRADQVLFFEVALPSGEIIKTGFAGHDTCKVKHLYPYGLGPDTRGLFFQSPFGIVLSVGYQLHLRHADSLTFHLEISEGKVPALVQAIADLKRREIIDCIVHIADPVRLRSTLEPILKEDTSTNQKIKEDILNQFLRTQDGQPVWSAVGVLSGTRLVVNAKSKEFKARIKGLGKLKLYREPLIQKLSPLILFFPRLETTLRATKALRGFTRGEASSAAIKMLFWSPAETQSPEYRSDGSLAIEKTKFATIFCVPLAPLNALGAEGLISIARGFAQEKNVVMGMTLNTLSPATLEAVVSLHFNPSETSPIHAHALFTELNQRYIAAGLFPYRLNPGIQKTFVRLTAHLQFSKMLAAAIDPQGLVSPGHYLKNE